MKAPVTAAMIVRDDPKAAEAIRSIAPYVEEVVVVITQRLKDDPMGNCEAAGFWANLNALCGELGVRFVAHYLDCNDPITGEILDFSAARNRTLELATQPWWLYLDSDDTIEGAENLAGEIAVLSALRATNHAVEICGEYPYWYHMDDAGRPTRIVPTRRIISNPRNWRWEDPCHEALYLPNGQYAVHSRDALVWKHHRVGSSGDRNLRILAKHVAENPNPRSRVLFYFANELADAADRAGDDAARGKFTADAISIYERYLRDLVAPQDERYMAALRAAKLSLTLGQYDDALHWASMAMCFNETLPAAYVQMARVFQARDWARDQERCLFACDAALRAKGTTYMWTDPTDAFDVQFMRTFALMRLGRNREAVEAGLEAMKIRPEESSPHSSNIAFNTRQAEARLAIDDLLAQHAKLDALAALKHPVIDETLKGVPNWMLGNRNVPMTQQPDIAAQAATYWSMSVPALKQISEIHSDLVEAVQTVQAEKKKTGPLRIVFLCGEAWEEWGPAAVEKGMGGSETAVVEMARRLAKRGHTVTVWSKSSPEGVFDGVTYTKGYSAGFDVSIAWRDAELLPQFHSLRILWIHDVYAQNEQFANRADKIFALSQWHKSFLVDRGYDASKIVVTRNGIDPGLYTTLEAEDAVDMRDPYAVVYSSSPDRGLLSLLQMWPEIKKREPRATLRVYYGFSGWNRVAFGDGPTAARYREETKALLANMADLGVVHYGRVSKKELALSMLSAGVLALPTWFNETYCITLDEALAAGLEVVTSPIAALKERGEGKVRFVEGDWLSKEYQERFVEQVILAMRYFDDSKYKDERQYLMAQARSQNDWERAVDQWEKEFGYEKNTKEGAMQMMRDIMGSAVFPWSRSKIEPGAPQKKLEIEVMRPRRIHFVLTKYGVGDPPIDPRDPFNTMIGGGSRVGFMGLARAMAKYPAWEVFAWSHFTSEATVDGVDCRQYGNSFDSSGEVRPGDVVFAFYDTRPLAAVDERRLRIASHHAYEPWDDVTADIQTAPSNHTVEALKKRLPNAKHWAVLPNGVGDRPVVRKPVKGRIIYHTSPDRGLHHLLLALPEIRRQVPEATLHVVGNVDGWLEWAVTHPKTRARAHLVAAHRNDPGVKILGYIPFADLMRELGEASVFAYPCDTLEPSESFSVSVMECLKIGLPVVLRPADALGEVYKRGTCVIAGDTSGDFIEAVVSVLVTPHLEWSYTKGKELAAKFTFEAEAARLDVIIGDYEKKMLVPEWVQSGDDAIRRTYAEARPLPAVIQGIQGSASAMEANAVECEKDQKPESLQRAWTVDERRTNAEAYRSNVIGDLIRSSGGATVDNAADTKTIYGPMGAFIIPATPERTRQVCEQLSRQVWDGEYDTPEVQAYAKVQNSYVTVRSILDLGCGWGAFAVWVRARWPEATIMGFDPHARALDYCKINAPFMQVHQAAVTTNPKPKIHLEDDWGHTRFKGGETEVVAIHPGQLPPCDLLKVDTEGCDLEVLSSYQHMKTLKILMYEWHHPEHRAPMADICRGAGLRQVKDAPCSPQNVDFGLAVWVRA